MSARLRKALSDLDDAFPASKMDRATFGRYMTDLSDLAQMDEDAVITAMQELRLSSRFLPTIREIRETVADLMRRDLWVVAEAAWGEVERECRRVGANPVPRWGKDPLTGEYRTFAAEEPRFSSPILAAAVESIGWRNICMAEDKDRSTVRAQLRKAIEAIQERARYEVVSGRYLTPSGDPPIGAGGMASMGDVIDRMIGDGRQARQYAPGGDDDHEP